jgi:hypothetical protein
VDVAAAEQDLAAWNADYFALREKLGELCHGLVVGALVK